MNDPRLQVAANPPEHTVAEPFENLPEGVAPSDANPFELPPTDTVSEDAFQTPGEARSAASNPWSWVPSLYFAEAVPYALVMTVSVVFYNRMGLSNIEIGVYTSLLYLPWVIKPLWSPLVDVVGTKRRWILLTQSVVAFGIVGIGLFAPSPWFLVLTLGCFTLLAVASATHDIAADGFYMIGMDTHRQAMFVGIRSSFYRLGSILGGGILVALAGTVTMALVSFFTWQITFGDLTVYLAPYPFYQWATALAWSITFGLAGISFFGVALYHSHNLPYCEKRKPRASRQLIADEMVDAIESFLRKPNIVLGITYILLYRFAEGQLTKLVQPFLIDPLSKGGLALSLQTAGLLYGTIGVLLLVLGGIVGGIVVARDGLGRWFMWMAAAINLPNIAYVALAFWQPQDLWLVALAVGIEQFGYGFGFAGYMLYMLSLCKGEHETAHYALCTGIMALGMMLPGFLSGFMQNYLGYSGFFVWVLIATIPSFVVAWLVPIDPLFGKSKTENSELEA